VRAGEQRGTVVSSNLDPFYVFLEVQVQVKTANQWCLFAFEGGSILKPDLLGLLPAV
jgi:hypothetical protein